MLHHCKQAVSLFVLLIIVLMSSATAYAQISPTISAEPENLYFTKQRLVQYHDSGNYSREQTAVVDKAIAYLKQQLAANAKAGNKKKLAIVLDIDDTAISNYKSLHKLRFGGSPEEIVKLKALGNDPVISPTLKLFNFAKQHNVAIFFVTGRPEKLREATIRNLHHAGYKDWTKLFMKPESYHLASVVPFKSGVRNRLQKQSYDIVINLGDQFSDLIGGAAQRAFKMPNPYYYIM